MVPDVALHDLCGEKWIDLSLTEGDALKDCNAQASSLSGDARKQFMSSCLSGSTAEIKKPNCVNGKPCGNSCIAKDKVCHK